jgi:acetylornithine deacetylase
LVTLPQLPTVELLSHLISFDSVSRNSNLPIADFICNYFDAPGFRVHRIPSKDGLKTNVLVQAGPEESGPGRDGLVLSGHMDVVPADEAEWVSDPFTLTLRDGRYHGRGAADMKGFLALAMNRLASVTPAQLRHPLALLFTYDEEVGTMGARRFAESSIERAPLPRRTVIGEPTTLKVARMHKGHIKLRFTFRGKASHSGYPHLGHNAIEPAGRAIVALSDLRAQLERERPALGRFFEPVPFVTLNVAQVAGGVAVNIIPERCVLDVGLRLLPGMDKEPVIRRIRERVESMVGAEPFEFAMVNESPPMLVEDSAEVYRGCCAEVGQTSEHTIAYTTDGGWLQQAGLECVIFGPGSIEVAHRPNEYIGEGELIAGAEVLERLVQRYCL